MNSSILLYHTEHRYLWGQLIKFGQTALYPVSIFPPIDESKSPVCCYVVMLFNFHKKYFLLIFETSCLSFSFLYSVSSKRILVHLSFGNSYILDTNANRAFSQISVKVYIKSKITCTWSQTFHDKVDD